MDRQALVDSIAYCGLVCGKDMHAPPHDLRIRAFVSFIKAEGANALVDCLLANEARGTLCTQLAAVVAHVRR